MSQETAPTQPQPPARTASAEKQALLEAYDTVLKHQAETRETELRKADNQKMTNLIRRLPNINIICPRSGTRRGECYATSLRQPQKYAVLGGECPLDVYIDGAASTDNDLEKMRINEYAGVEYYPGGSTIPMQYNRTGSSCGVLLFWTRER